MGWLNEAAAKYGGKQVRCVHSRQDTGTDDADLGRWITKVVRHLLCVDMGTPHAPNSSKEVAYYWQIGFYGGLIQLKGPEKDDAVPASLGIIPRNGADHGRYDDNW